MTTQASPVGTIWAHLRHLVEQGRASLNDGQLGTDAPDAIFATA